MGALIVLHFGVLGVATSESRRRALLHRRVDGLVGRAGWWLRLGRWLGRVVGSLGRVGRLLELLLGLLLNRLVRLRWGLVILLSGW